uniref:AMP-binding enzyme C-terminal domain-containing protein n=1 Tax=Timema cristinae TaxID=61476 RepID=A0A7R9GQA8_TIMCR|nr:unnamed protein product [Timema cristinae]
MCDVLCVEELCSELESLSCLEELQCGDVEVSSYKRLRGGVKFVDFIPKTSTGKIQRKLLAQQTPPPKEKTCDLV